MNIKWNAAEYKNNFDFVPAYGADVLALIEHKPGAFAVDLGCGNGTLTQELKNRGYRVLGIDASQDMLDLARKNYPDIEFMLADATEFKLPQKADIIFSNAVFHWINQQQALIQNLFQNLKDTGELVFEFGGYGCAETVHAALEEIFKEKGLKYKRSFYFPKIGEYAALLESHGFTVKYAVLFDRPTKQIGESGLKNWILMFDKEPFAGIEDSLKEEIILLAEQRLKEKLYKDNTWFVDYVRIRMRAVK